MTQHQDSAADPAALAWQALLDHSNVALLFITTDDKVHAASRAACELFGLSHAEIRSHTLRSLLRQYDADGPQLSERIPVPDQHGHLQGAILRFSHSETDSLIDRSIRAVRRREHQLRQVLLAIGSELEIDTLLTRVVELSIAMFDADAGSLPIYEAQYDRLVPGHVVNLPEPQVLTSHYRDTGMIWDLIDTGRPFIINDYPAQPRAMPGLVRIGVQAVMAVPIRGGGRVIGVLALYHRRPQAFFNGRDLELLTIIAQQTGIALHNARLYQAALTEAEHRQILYSASIEIGAALDLEQLYRAIHHAVEQLMPVDALVIGLYDEENSEIEYSYLWDHHQRWPPMRRSIDSGLIGYIVRTDVSLRVENIGDEFDEIFQAFTFGLEEFPSRSLMATVLKVGDLVIGGISVQSSQPQAYTSTDLGALEMLAATVAIALENARLFRQIQQIATLDPLTAIANRRHFFELATREVERAARYNHPLSVIMIDADHFKTINDRYGHMIGDQVLQTIALRCRNSLREVDLIARYGGEEFVVLLPETDSAQAMVVAERLRDAINLHPVFIQEPPLHVSISLGVASSTDGRMRSLEELLDAADRALYRAKTSGRNQVRSEIAEAA